MELNTHEAIEHVCDLLDLVISTMGPNGKLVAINELDPVPKVTKDGVTVMESLKVTSDSVTEKTILALVKEASRKTDAIVGDSTTTTACITSSMLSSAIYNQGLDYFTHDRVEIIRGLADIAVQLIREEAKQVTSEDDIKRIIKTSTNNDEELTKIIFEAFKASNFNSSITINEENEKATETTLEVKDGLYFDTITHIFDDVNLKEARLVLISGKVNNMSTIESVLRQARDAAETAIIIASGFHENVLDKIKINRDRGKVEVYAMQAEGFNNEEYKIMKAVSDILHTPIYTTVDSNTECIKQCDLNDCALVSAQLTRRGAIIDGKKDKKVIKELTKQYSPIRSEDTAKFILSKVTPTPIITVGANTEARKNEVKDRLTDAILAAESVVNGGYVIGGGYTLYKVSRDLRNPEIKDKLPKGTTENELDMVCVGLMSVFENLSLLTSKTLQYEEDKAMYNFKTMEYIEKGTQDGLVYDPAEGLCQAILNATEVVCTVLSIKGIIDASPANY